MMQRCIPFILFLILSNFQCCIINQTGTSSDPMVLADGLEQSLFEYIVDPWYPRIIDSIHGGYISEFERDWTLSEGAQLKALVQQSRHVWATAMLYENHPERTEFLEYAGHGFEFMKDVMWDQEFGGFHTLCTREGRPDTGTINDKRIYGQAFSIYGLSQYYKVSKDPEALQLAQKEFQWIENHAHDPEHGGYFEFLQRDGTVLPVPGNPEARRDAPRTVGLKDYNSSIHVMEALTELYKVWPDPLVRERLEEMFFLIRDTFAHPDGYLQLYFYPDWKLVSVQTPDALNDEHYHFFHHFTYGHDVETAYLLLETAHVLGWEKDETTHRIAKRLVDHSLKSGWDAEAGGFYNEGIFHDGEISIVNDHKSWWAQVEGLNALLLMFTLYPEDPQNYFEKFLKSWEHIDTYLIDKEYGGWFNHALDTYPGSKDLRKSHIWKTTYHNARGLVNCIRMLHGEAS